MFDEKKPDEALTSEGQTSNEPVDMFSEAGSVASTPEMSEGQMAENAAEGTGPDAAIEEEYEDAAPRSGKRHMILALIAIVALILIIGGGVSLVFLLKPKQAVEPTDTSLGVLGDISGTNAAIADARKKARDSKRIADIKQLQAALELYASDKSYYPSTDNFSTELLAYLSPIPEDPTNEQPLVYTYMAKPDGCTSECTSYELAYQLEGAVGSLVPGVTNIAKSFEDLPGRTTASQPVPPESPLPTEPPVAADADGDGISDDAEAQYGTNPNLFDSDGDGLSDREELEVYGTDPLNADSDKDGFLDGEEIKNGYDPNGSGRLPSALPQ